MKLKAEGWPADFSWDASAKNLLVRVDETFGPVERPSYFTDVDHCWECREHHKELSVRPRMELQRSDLGSSGWDPVIFTSAEGIAHLFPLLARYAMAPSFWSEHDWYGEALAFHLTYDGNNNRFYRHCDFDQRSAVTGVIEWVIENRKDEIELYGADDDWLNAWGIWSK